MGCWLSKGSPADTAMPQDEAMPERMAKALAAAEEKKKRDEHGDAEAAAISLELDPAASVEIEGLVRHTRLEP